MSKARDAVLRRARSQKTVRVLVRCWYVDSDGTPLDMNGESPNGRKGWRQAWEWGKRDRSLKWLRKHPNAWRPIR
jgi:hypothetical protein